MRQNCIALIEMQMLQSYSFNQYNHQEKRDSILSSLQNIENKANSRTLTSLTPKAFQVQGLYP